MHDDFKELNELKISKYHVVIVVLLILLSIFIFNFQCNPEPVVQIPDNSEYLRKIDSLEQSYEVLKSNSEVLKIAYEKEKQRKNVILSGLKPKYITIHDTITNDSIEVLPKVHVDSLIEAYESIILDADTIIKVQSHQIVNLEQQNEQKDIIISNNKIEKDILVNSVKKEKRRNWFSALKGFGLGFLTGKVT